MLSVRLRRWSAWAPGRESPESWRDWCREPSRLAAEGAPAARFLPPMLRRRCTPLSKIALTAAFECCEEAERAQVRSVFASRHGSINESITLLEAIARGKPLSPARFSHTVHNAQAGLFSIAAGNRQASSSLSAQEDTFACGWIEALGHLEREPERRVLLVTADVPLAASFAKLVREPVAAYALALLLARDGEGTGVTLRPEAPPPGRPEPEWPDALEFLRWLHSDELQLDLGRGVRGWRFARA